MATKKELIDTATAKVKYFQQLGMVVAIELAIEGLEAGGNEVSTDAIFARGGAIGTSILMELRGKI